MGIGPAAGEAGRRGPAGNALNPILPPALASAVFDGAGWQGSMVTGIAGTATLEPCRLRANVINADARPKT